MPQSEVLVVGIGQVCPSSGSRPPSGRRPPHIPTRPSRGTPRRPRPRPHTATPPAPPVTSPLNHAWWSTSHVRRRAARGPAVERARVSCVSCCSAAALESGVAAAARAASNDPLTDRCGWGASVHLIIGGAGDVDLGRFLRAKIDWRRASGPEGVERMTGDPRPRKKEGIRRIWVF